MRCALVTSLDERLWAVRTSWMKLARAKAYYARKITLMLMTTHQQGEIPCLPSPYTSTHTHLHINKRFNLFNSPNKLIRVTVHKYAKTQ